MTVPPPHALLAAFRADETVGDIAVLLVEDGFDAVTLRVLAAWQRSAHRWQQPKTPCPDGGRPTPAAWDWLCSGWDVDLDAVSRGAGVTRDVARERMEILQHARLIYPDGTCAARAKQAMDAVIMERLTKGRKPKKRPRDEGSDAN